MAQLVKNQPAKQETWVRIPGSGRYPEKEMATYSSILAWRIPWKRSLLGYNPWGRKELETTEQLSFSLDNTILFLIIFLLSWKELEQVE